MTTKKEETMKKIAEAVNAKKASKQTVDNHDCEDIAIPIELPLKSSQLPPIIRQVVENAPKSRKIPSFIACMPPLSAIATRLRAKYFYDTNRQHAMLIQVIIEGPQSSGKSFAADISSLIMRKTLEVRDTINRRIELEYREKRRRRSQNKELEKEPLVVILMIPVTCSKTMLLKRADSCLRKYGDYLTLYMFSEELSELYDAGKNSYANLNTIMRKAYDLGSTYGQDYMSDNSYSASADIMIAAMFCATPQAVDDYYNNHSVEGGNITRGIICEIKDDTESDHERFRPYTEEQMIIIKEYLQKMMDDVYSADDKIEPTKLLDMQWLDRDCQNFINSKAELYQISGNEAVKVFRKRASVSAFRITTLCYYLYSLQWDFDPRFAEGKADEEEETKKNKVKARKYCKKIYNWLAEYIISGLLKRWGSKFNELNSKRLEKSLPQPRLFDLLPDEFTRDDLKLIIKQIGCASPAKKFLNKWGPRNLNLIESIGNDRFKKTNK